MQEAAAICLECVWDCQPGILILILCWASPHFSLLLPFLCKLPLSHTHTLIYKRAIESWHGNTSKNFTYYKTKKLLPCWISNRLIGFVMLNQSNLTDFYKQFSPKPLHIQACNTSTDHLNARKVPRFPVVIVKNHRKPQRLGQRKLWGNNCSW